MGSIANQVYPKVTANELTCTSLNRVTPAFHSIHVCDYKCGSARPLEILTTYISYISASVF